MTDESTAPATSSRFEALSMAIEGDGIRLRRLLRVQNPTGLFKQALPFRLNRRLLIGAMVVVAILLAPVVVISTSKVSKLTIALSNHSDRDLTVRVWVDDFDDQCALLEPEETVTFEWRITGKTLHRFATLAHDSDALVSAFLAWIYIEVYPFTEKVLAFDIS